MTDDQPQVPDYACHYCGGPTVYQLFSGGREWYCEACDSTGNYEQGHGALPRATLLQTPEGVVALRAQMDQELARRHERNGSLGAGRCSD